MRADPDGPTLYLREPTIKIVLDRLVSVEFTTWRGRDANCYDDTPVEETPVDVPSEFELAARHSRVARSS